MGELQMDAKQIILVAVQGQMDAPSPTLYSVL